MSKKLSSAAAAAILSLCLASPAMASPTYAPAGPQTNVSISTVTSGGWTLCYSAPYGTFGPTIASAVAGCTGDLMMLAGGPNAIDPLLARLSVLAWAPEVDVMFGTGTGNTTHEANDTEWYFDPNFSWGFAPKDAPVNRNSCDIAASTSFGGVNATTPERLCWHTGNGEMNGGWRVGAVDFLNFEPSGYTKYIFTASSQQQVPEPGTLAIVGVGLLAAWSRRRAAR